jgi:hypothetical protein
LALFHLDGSGHRAVYKCAGKFRFVLKVKLWFFAVLKKNFSIIILFLLIIVIENILVFFMDRWVLDDTLGQEHLGANLVD